MAKAKHMAAELVALTAAERLARARERLAEVRGQIADVAQRIDDRRRALDALQHLAKSARQRAEDAEREHEALAEAVVEARVGLMLAEGTEDEPAAREGLAAAEAQCMACADELQRLAASATEIAEKTQAEQRAIRAELETDEKARDDLARLVSSLERQEVQAHAAAGLERLAQLRAERAALDARRAELREMVAAADADLQASYADVDALMREWPTIADAREVRELRPAPLSALHEVAEAGAMLCDVLERHAGSPAVMGFWRNGVNAPFVLGELAPDVVRDLFTIYGGNVLPRVQGIRGRLRALSAAAAEHEAQIVEQLPRVLEQVSAADETPPAA